MSTHPDGMLPAESEPARSLRRFQGRFPVEPVRPAGVLRSLSAAGVTAPLWLSAGGMLGTLALCMAAWSAHAPPLWLPLGLIGGIGVSLLGLAVAGARLRQRLLRPLMMLEDSVGRVCQGDPGASLTVENAGVLRGLVQDIQSLDEELTGLYEDMDNRVARQTRRLAQKTASLKILYEVAASINHADDLSRLLIRYLRVLKDMVNGLAATVRLEGTDGRMRLVGSIGLDGKISLEHQMLPLPLCRCGATLSPGDILCAHGAAACSAEKGRHMFGPDEVERVEVPIEYHDTRLGSYHIYVEKPGIAGREDVLELLATIGSHLGMAVAKQRSDAEARRLSIMEERNHLAHELHDSLAQTLASLRFQVRMLEETLETETVAPATNAEVQRIRNGLDEAHVELRELLNSFRAPLDERGLVPALEKLAGRFRQETGISIFFQEDCRGLELSAHEELQLLRIVQESLANIRKHAQAHTVRVLLRCRSPGNYLLLVEDDGVGFERPPAGGRPGEHIGLSIMEERARRIGAELRIESEPGEGTRVEMLFRPRARVRGVA